LRKGRVVLGEKTYDWAAQALVVAPAAAVVEVVKAEGNVVEDEDWAAARVKPRATTRVVSCMVVTKHERHGKEQVG
jgi:hypothetical protein